MLQKVCGLPWTYLAINYSLQRKLENPNRDLAQRKRQHQTLGDLHATNEFAARPWFDDGACLSLYTCDLKRLLQQFQTTIGKFQL